MVKDIFMESNIEEKIFVLYNFSKEEKVLFLQEFQSLKYDTKTAVILALVAGFVGGQFFYLGRYVAGILCLIFSFTFIPMFIGFIHAFMLPKTVKTMNKKNAEEIAMRIIMRRKNQKKQKSSAASAPAQQVIIREIVKIPCPYCSTLVENTSSNCPNCGGVTR
ncbi:hypothetical protein KKF34_12735 [Myxococcota bacterium]|nr:hypothetical protein [Myxococcota bacterium]MBU1380607.1 hypothetical protein [Myxococcota bacterium]MBU1497732.1 hypothetical protein [Myxococcota bacterium]